MRIRAAVLEEFGQPLAVQEVELGEPKAGEALVRLAACGVCHTDLYTASGADPTGYAPCVLGHEGAGVVEAVGPDVRFVRPRDHVITLFAPECGECIHCRSPKTNRCVAIRDQQGLGYLPDGTTRLLRDGEPLRHFMGTSTFAEYAVLPEIALVRVRPVDGHRRRAEHSAGGTRLDRGRLRVRPRRPGCGDRRQARGRGADHRTRPLG
jgi:S-(hydroxymethyl)glutathione dehydrogenase/alcohol dehydrogenase